jgi:hypothetical protein
MTDAQLMAGIRDRLGTLISGVAATASIPQEFIAALIANESGGNQAAARFEPLVSLKLQDVIMARRAAFEVPGIARPLGRQEILLFVNPPEAAPGVVKAPVYSFTDSLKQLEWLATSRGLTQIMGWHTVEFSKPPGVIADALGNLQFALVLLAYFANRYQLDARNDFVELFTCWNTGEPDGKTYDANYVPQGLARMRLYAQALAAPQETPQ